MAPRSRRLLILALGLVLVPLLIARPTPVSAARNVAAAPTRSHAQVRASAAARPCSAGLVALTFDDGPIRGLTSQLVTILQAHHAPATFFMVGSRIQRAPGTARVVARAGFPIGNHTWSHPDLTRLSDQSIRAEIRSTARELRAAGITPGTLMRPPYGAIDARVRADLAALRLVPVLWTIDSRDWAGGDAREIADRILGHLQRHRTNIVLQHDGVQNSPASVAAVPLVIATARHRGYCFSTIGRDGQVTTPVPEVRATVTNGSETGSTAVRVLVSLTQPTTRRVSVRIQTTPVSAVPGSDYVPVVLRVGFPSGSLRQWVTIPVLDDHVVEPTESFRVLFAAPSGLVVPRPQYLARIASDDVAAN